MATENISEARKDELLFSAMTGETHPLFEKKPLKRDITKRFGLTDAEEAPSLTIYIKGEGNSWQSKGFTPGKGLVKIGSDKEECEILIGEGSDVSRRHVAIRENKEFWHIIERAQTRSMLINGMKRPQQTLGRGMSCILQIGGAEMIAINHSDSESARLNPDMLYTVKSPGPELKLPVEGTALIGSNPECKIRFPGLPEFAGIIYSFSKTLYICPCGAEPHLCVDGQEIKEPRHLKHKARISMGDLDLFSVEYPEELREAVGFTVLPSFSRSHLALMPVGASEESSRKLILPSPGRSIFVGRGSENHFVIESPKISRRHAQLVIYDNSVMAMDCGSTNGISINDERASRKMLHPGDIIQFGDRNYLLCHSE